MYIQTHTYNNYSIVVPNLKYIFPQPEILNPPSWGKKLNVTVPQFSYKMEAQM